MSGVIRPAKDVPPRPVERADGAVMRVLIGPDDHAPHFVTRKFTIQPGGRIPKHRHPTIEHEQYVLSGRMRLGIGGEVREVSAGDAVFIPAGTPHWYENHGTEPVEFLCVVPRTPSYPTEWLE
ncbi:MAG: cupin domain-containing protein [Armatimonadota bacterium]|nr:cupin domain-containing protein [Armatimonadota bacterium]MDR5697052.1 cupin domain-containing protein [Armatimonadota bacterium]